jgi:hypothetical protein
MKQGKNTVYLMPINELINKGTKIVINLHVQVHGILVPKFQAAERKTLI